MCVCSYTLHKADSILNRGAAVRTHSFTKLILKQTSVCSPLLKQFSVLIPQQLRWKELEGSWEGVFLTHLQAGPESSGLRKPQ